MVALLAMLVLLARTSFSSTECSTGEWSSSYFVNGVISVPYAEIQEPFTAWYDAKSGASRIDYYGGMMKTYQLKHQPGQFGSLSKIVPVTDGETVNLNRCLQVNGTKSFSVDIQSVLPDLSSYKFVSNQVLNTLETEKWQYFMEMDNGNKNNTYTMYLTYQPNSPKTKKWGKAQPKQPIPVRFEMQGYNTLLGSHYDHYYIDYMNYNDDPIPSAVFTIKEGTPCTSYPGPGSKASLKRFSFNPMMQFIETKKSYNLFQKLFHSFKFTHKKAYKDEHEHEKRHFEFLHNHRFIESMNRANLGFQLKINHLADRSKQELKIMRGRKYQNEYNGGLEFQYAEKDVKRLVNGSFDWRLLGAVTPVKDQSFCGSCWSFASTGEIEGAYFLKYGKLVRFSEQALIDCSWEFQNNGCDGGEDFRSYKWIVKHGGLPTNEQYGNYLGADGYCHFENMTLIGAIDKYYNVTPNDSDALRVALVQHGPVSVSIDASPKAFSFYSHGLFYDTKCKNKIDELDHAVLLVGYGQWNGQLYWLIKNSWSTYWGNDGYVLISAKDNNCGVMTDPTFVTLK